MLAQIDAPHFNCGVVLLDYCVIKAAPIVKYMHGWQRNNVREYCRKKGWRVSVIRETS